MVEGKTSKIALISGASSGIGEAVARLFARDGFVLLLVARRKERIERLAGELREEHGREVHPISLDVRDYAAVQSAAKEHGNLFSRVTVLVNNAGLARGLDYLHQGSVDDWEEMIDTNIKGLLYLTRTILPHMVERGDGHVINIGSVSGRQLYAKGAVYCGTKFAVRGINEGLRIDLHGTGVRVSSVDPGMVDTEFSLVRFHGDDERARQVYRNTRPLTAEDVAEAVHWCTSRPKHVNVQELLLMPTDQASTTMIDRSGA
jgi:3-hydroxy acid dehydrogenase/malonic semialdehyde reductase